MQSVDRSPQEQQILRENTYNMWEHMIEVILVPGSTVIVGLKLYSQFSKVDITVIAM